MNQSNYPNYYHPQNSVSPPPLQHPIPTHPPIQMHDPPTVSPSPPAHGMQYQPSPGFNPPWGLNDATTQMGMQFGRTAFMAGINNSYVANKIKLVLFPWRHRRWSRLVKRSEENGQMEGYKPPRDDIICPDLYIPAMGLVTYVLLTGIVSGTQRNKFHPEILGVNATSALLLMVLELAFIKIGCYLINITSETQILDLLAYSGYKFIGIIVTMIVSLIAPFWVVVGTFFYAAFANGFFLLRSLRYIVIPDSTTTVNPQPQRKRRINFLFLVASLQVILMYLLIK
ncbi:3970_t:CDS:2 [Acaulospora morrowiae]|uniref:Protein YIF1 n=1 Tax=Acaulospora morrowiae TaxID=94023 RepID=A0A9N9CK77_9GLOM|nr:3970_t:CDS:2 [Acaulospora morrowiae]